MVAQRLAQAALQRIRMWLTLKCTLVIWCFHLHANEEVEGRRGSVGGWFWVLCDNWVWRRRSNLFDNKTKGMMEIQSGLSVSVFLCLSFFSPKIISLSAVEAQPWGRKEKLTNENRRSAPWTATLLPAASEGKRRKLSFSNKIISHVSVRPYRSFRLPRSLLSSIFNALHCSKDDICHTSRQKKCWFNLTNHLVSVRKSFGLKRLFWLPKTKLQMILASRQKNLFLVPN